MKPEELARIQIDRQLLVAGWDVVDRDSYIPKKAQAVREALMQGSKESDYLLFVDDKAIAVIEAKKEGFDLVAGASAQAEGYSRTPNKWYGTWMTGQIPLVYLADGKKIYFKNMLEDSEYELIKSIHSPKQMLQIIGQSCEYGALPRLDEKGLRSCQYEALINFEELLRCGGKRALAVLATGSGKTYLACYAVYRLLEYTSVKRVLFLVDRNNLGRQAQTQFSTFDKTVTGQPMSELYSIKRLTRPEYISSTIVIATIQKLFATLTGQEASDEPEDIEYEYDESDDGNAVRLGDDLKIPADHFDFIIVDECHRSIYGKWKSVLEYFSGATILGLTATATADAYGFFDGKAVKKYGYEDSVLDGVNVPYQSYRIRTQLTESGGTIEAGDEVVVGGRGGDHTTTHVLETDTVYSPTQLDRTVLSDSQIRTNLQAYKDAIYTEIFTSREPIWEYIPKTLIFAKDDSHATRIVEATRQVFAPEFAGGVPDEFVQKITYSAGDTDELIRQFRTSKKFRIAVTVTLVSTGTDIKPLEVVLFMRDVGSAVLYTQMKGRACRVIGDDKLREVTPNADTKAFFYVVDCVGVTEHDMVYGGLVQSTRTRPIRLKDLLEQLSHGYLTDENLARLRDYCASINHRYERDSLFGHYLEIFVSDFGFSPGQLANEINVALESEILEPFVSSSAPNTDRHALIARLMSSIPARKMLLQMNSGYYAITQQEDELIEKGFIEEEAGSYIEGFEKYLHEHRDSIEALRIIYNSEDTIITHHMLKDLQDRLLAENPQYRPYTIWNRYKQLYKDDVDSFDTKQQVQSLTLLIQIARFAYKKSPRLVSLQKGYARNFTLYCGQKQRELTDHQQQIMRRIADYIINDGHIGVLELNEVDPDLWRVAHSYMKDDLPKEIEALSKFLLKAA